MNYDYTVAIWAEVENKGYFEKYTICNNCEFSSYMDYIYDLDYEHDEELGPDAEDNDRPADSE